MPTLEVDGATLDYETSGSGWPIVLLHGGWLDRDLWTPQVERFAGDFRVVTPDLRGHGDSDTVDPDSDAVDSDSDAVDTATADNYDVERMAADVTALCEHLGLARPVVCGLSMGGLVAQQFALAHTDRLAGLVLADTVTSVPPVPGTESARRLLFPTGPARLLARQLGPGAYFRSVLGTVEAAEGRWLALDDDPRAYALDCIDAYDADGFLGVLEAFYRDRPRDLSGLRVPTLLLHGDHEATPVVTQNRRLERTIPDAERIVLPDAGHLSSLDNPSAFGDALEDFLDERVSVPA